MGGVFASTGSSTVGFIIVYIFGRLGLLSTIGNTAVWSISAASEESEIAEVNAKIEQMDEFVANAAEGIDTFGTIIQDEIITNIKWDNSLDYLANKFASLALKRKSFTYALKELRNIAQDFRD